MVAVSSSRRNEESPFRALTHKANDDAKDHPNGRNEESPFRALTPFCVASLDIIS